MSRKRCNPYFTVLTLIILIFLQGAPGLDLKKSFSNAAKDFDFFPELHIRSEVIHFLGHRHEEDKKLYFFDLNMELEGFLISYKERYSIMCGLFTGAGLGRQNTSVVFDPRYVHYGVIPGFELRFSDFDIKTGLEHFCYHDVDMDDGISELVNKAYISGQSKNYRLAAWRKSIADSQSWKPLERLAWKAKWGHFLRRGFGIVPDPYVATGHNYLHETTLNGRYAFYMNRHWILDGEVLFNWNYGQPFQDWDAGVYHTYGLILCAHWLHGYQGTRFYLAYNFLDELLLRPHDRIFMLGLGFYF
jgi:hypothetical protein